MRHRVASRVSMRLGHPARSRERAGGATRYRGVMRAKSCRRERQHLRLAAREERSGLTNPKNWRHLLYWYVGKLFLRIAFVIRAEKSPIRRGRAIRPGFFAVTVTEARG